MKNDGLSNVSSFLLALGMYFFVVLFVFFRLVLFDENALQYTDLKDNVIDIELSAPSKKIIVQNNTNKVLNSKQELDIEKLFEQTTNKAVKTDTYQQEATDFNALFGTVEDIQQEKDTKVQSSAQSANKSSSLSASELVKQLNDSLIPSQIHTSGESFESQKSGIYDEFLGRVTRVITERWKQYYPNDEIAVKVKIVIDSEGKFSYTSVEKSNNALYDAKVAEFLESQKGKFIAYPPKGQALNITMNLRDDLKTSAVVQ
ncbi:TonB C-terminal domain-containing protein [Campylobacter sp. MIT 21-1685]|uniref:TonB C-terminal domain-containing protein n=1 Tax=unclassified Campylobacter TaxID=2593542 RepID=UPI00224AD5A3|nr:MULTISPECIES: TonB C-terminal domain-containing protein [unclassified Campylobacter]MCX2683329.1 TonB C-terminal domain-containing protein [Campylobacter sp. MIT 21-1684]MCX2751616.1 TonB C-terminal domain-containing protein [Campylobacter sp. MIT 21-1682]MCX2807815.1 TonB C-terminal domain-containing protein [Campylobacter sp. MIT 21-1685]